MAMARTSGSLTDRMIGAARLDVHTYEAVEADTSATSQALTVVVLAAVAAGIGGALAAAFDGDPTTGFVGSLFAPLFSELIGWGVWSYVMYFVGTRFFGGVATYGEVLRTLGFAYAPGVLMIFSFVPILGGLLALVVAIWRLVAGFVAVRQALDLSNGKTLLTIIVGIIAYVVVAAIIGLIFAALGLGAGLLFGM